MIAADIMSHPVITVSPYTSLAEAVRLVVDRRVSGLPIVDAAGRPLGMLTESDLLRRVETSTEGQAPGWFTSFFVPGRTAADYVRTHGRQVAEVMTPHVIRIEEERLQHDDLDEM